jgi:AraC-like DNA-binding protein
MVVFNFFTLLTGISGINLIFVSFYCLTKKPKQKSLATVFLSLFCFLLSLNFLYDILTLNQVYGPYLRYLDEFSLLLAFPALYFYVLSLTHNNLKFNRRHLLHAVPAIIFLLMWVFPPQSFLQWNRSSWMNVLYGHYNQLQFLFYIISIYRLLKKNDHVSRELISSPENGNLRWIKLLLVFLSTLFFSWILTDADLINENLIVLAILVFTYWLGYHTINQNEIYDQLPGDFSMESVTPGQNRYKNSRLTAADKKLYADRIEELMLREKPYLNNALTLTALADKADLKPIYLSQVLNEEFKENFYAFINRHRIQESQRLLKDSRYKNYNIQAIAIEAGFNSNSTFNKAFKELVGMSPSAYQKVQ